MSAGRDALTFFELLYGEQPPGKILICQTSNGKRWSTHACLAPADAVHYVLGNVDVFHRVGLVEQKPPAGKRGDESATTALTAVWLDVDVDGSPDGKGEVVTNAAPSLEAAVDLHHSVLEPSFLVGSGYGAHGYLRLAEPWLLHDDEDRQRAKRLVRGWHERIKREAVARGMAKFDSVFDLARVLRPVGSLNGKGARPVPVELLDDGGPVYTVEQIAAEIVNVDEPDSTPGGGTDGGPGRPVEELVEAFPQLEQIIRRKGKAPGKGSDSEWDFYLCCEGIRCGCNDGELAALIDRNRTVNLDPNGKRGRPDYTARTIAAAREKADADAADPAKRLTDRWGLREDPIVSGSTLGDVASGSAKVYLQTRGGRQLRFPRLGDLFEPAKHTRTVSLVTRAKFPPVTNAQATELAQAVIELCGGEDADPRDEAREYVIEFVAHAGATINALEADGTEKTRRQVLEECVKAEAKLQRENYGIAERAAIVVRGEEVWLPAGALKAYSGSRKPWGEFTSDLAEIGLQWRERYAKTDAGPVHRKFYVGVIEPPPEGQ